MKATLFLGIFLPPHPTIEISFVGSTLLCIINTIFVCFHLLSLFLFIDRDWNASDGFGVRSFQLLSVATSLAIKNKTQSTQPCYFMLNELERATFKEKRGTWNKK